MLCDEFRSWGNHALQKTINGVAYPALLRSHQEALFEAPKPPKRNMRWGCKYYDLARGTI